jgi:phytoene dehydrogenase-like protein
LAKERGVELRLSTRIERIERNGKKVTGVRQSDNGVPTLVAADVVGGRRRFDLVSGARCCDRIQETVFRVPASAG